MQKKSLVAPVVSLLAIVAAGPAPAADGESTVISGKMFADFTNIDLKNDGVESTANGTGVDVKRFYLGATHNFDDIWSVNLTTDFNYVANDSETQVFVKKAYLQAKLSDAFIARVGSADLPWVPFVEDLCGCRYIENEILDRLKLGTSADWGVHASGKAGDGAFNYAVSVVNGAGYKNPTRSNSMDFEGRVGFVPVKGLTLAVGAYSGKLGKDINNGPATHHTANRYTALVSYVDGPIRVGAEYFQAKDWANVTTVASDKADGYSSWITYNFTPMWGVLGRYDHAKPSKDLLPNLKDSYFNVGVVNHPRKNIDIALVYKYEKVDGGGTINTANGVIGGVNDGKYNEIGFWAQVAF